MLYKHLEALSYGDRSTSKAQESYVYEQLGNTYIGSVSFGLVIAIFASNIWVISFLITPVFIIQIINNMFDNNKKGINLSYALATLAYVLYLPFYQRAVQGNIFFTKPNYIFIGVNVVVILIFVIIL